MPQTIRDIGEFGLIRRVTKNLPEDARILQGIGDDCGVVKLGRQTLFLTCDASLEEIHFSLRYSPAEAVGWRAAVSAISDIAAMGGQPRFLLITFGAPPDTPLATVDGIFRGLRNAAKEFGATIVGGDTTRSDSRIVVDVSVLGVPAGKRWLTRAGAKPGDLVLVTGSPGHSGAGLMALQNGIREAALIKAHHHPVPRLAEAQWLAQRREIHALIDLSDGILADAAHIAEQSGVSINLHRDALPISPALHRIARRLERNPVDVVLAGGEDYELLFTAKRSSTLRLLRDFAARFPHNIHVIGEVTTDIPSSVSVDGEPPSSVGFQHFRTP